MALKYWVRDGMVHKTLAQNKHRLVVPGNLRTDRAAYGFVEGSSELALAGLAEKNEKPPPHFVSVQFQRYISKVIAVSATLRCYPRLICLGSNI